VGPRAGLDAAERRKKSLLLRKSNSGPPNHIYKFELIRLLFYGVTADK